MRVLTPLVFLIVVFSVKAETITLTLNDAVSRALDQSLNLKKSAIDLAQAEYAAAHLWSEIFPSLRLSAGLNILPSTNLFTDPGFTYNEDSVSYNLGLSLGFSFSASLKASMDRINLAYRSQLLSYEEASKLLEIQVTKDFLSLVTRQSNIAVFEESFTLAEQKLERDRSARANGLLSELEWLNSQFSVEDARYNLINARGNYSNALEVFLAALGIESGTDIIFQGTIEIAPVIYGTDELIFQYLPTRPDIIRQRQIIERLELSQTITSLNARTPSLEISFSWRGDNSNRLGTPNRPASPFTDSISANLSLNIPVESWIPGTRQNQNIRAAAADVEKAKLDLQNTETSARTQIRSLVSNLNNTLASIEIARLRMEIAQRTAEAVEVGFRQGTEESRRLEETRSALSNARQQLLQREYDYQSYLLDLAAALNVDWRILTGQSTTG